LAAYAAKGRAGGFLHNPIKFFRAAFSTILRSKIVENAALKKYYLAA